MCEFDLSRYLRHLDLYEQCHWNDEFKHIYSEDHVNSIMRKVDFHPLKLKDFNPDIPVLMDETTGKKKRHVDPIKVYQEDYKKQEKRRTEKERREIEKEERIRLENERRMEEERKEQERREAHEKWRQMKKEENTIRWIQEQKQKRNLDNDCIIAFKEYADDSDLYLEQFTLFEAGHFLIYDLSRSDIYGIYPINGKYIIAFLVRLDCERWSIMYAFDNKLYECSQIVTPSDEVDLRFHLNGIITCDFLMAYDYFTTALFRHHISIDKVNEFVHNMNQFILKEITDSVNPNNVKYVKHLKQKGNLIKSESCYKADCMKCDTRNYCMTVCHSMYDEYIYEIRIPDDWI